MIQVKVFKQPNYLQNFVQSTFNALGAERVKGICCRINDLSSNKMADVI